MRRVGEEVGVREGAGAAPAPRAARIRMTASALSFPLSAGDVPLMCCLGMQGADLTVPRLRRGPRLGAVAVVRVRTEAWKLERRVRNGCQQGVAIAVSAVEEWACGLRGGVEGLGLGAGRLVLSLRLRAQEGKGTCWEASVPCLCGNDCLPVQGRPGAREKRAAGAVEGAFSSSCRRAWGCSAAVEAP